MVKGSAKRVVVIKNIPSSVIEEAILILKTEPEKEEDTSKGAPKGAFKDEPDGSLLKEAEAIINNYIKENNLYVIRDRRLEAKKKWIKEQFFSNVVVNIVLAASIVFLLCLLIKLF